MPKLTTFLKPIEKRAETEVESQNSAEVVCINQSVEHDDIEENIATSNKNVNEEDVNRSPRNHRNEDQEDSNSDTNDAIEQINLEKSSELFSTDIANFHGKMLTKDIKKIIVLSESCRPKGPFIRDPLQENRRFSKKYFKTTTKYGSIERMWLCYSPKLDAVYCEPCWLFSEDRKAKDNWREHGVRDWRGLSKKIKTHENSQQHIFACCIYEKWRHNETIDKNIEEQIRYQSNFWVQVLERIVNITLALCKNSLAFRGHRESFDNEYNGNFLTQVQLLAKYDNVMKQVLSMPNGSIKYLSHQIQNEVIHCLATHLKATLTADINSSPFYSIIMDTTQDITKRDQLSQVFRYVKIIKNEKDEATSIEIKEVFLGFTEIYNHTAAGLHEEILNLLEKHHIKLSNCRGQGYDGANVMSGIYNGVQALFKKNQPNAMYMHCAAHNLNLVINDAVKCCVEVASFFVMLEDVYSFFGNSINRWDLLSKYTGESQITLKRLNPTRWAGRYTSLFVVKIRFLDIMKALSEISITSTKREEREEAVRIQKNMSSFEFVFLCVLLSKILNEVHIPSKLLQTKNLDLTAASGSLENASKNLKQYRKMFDSAKLEAIEIATTWQIPAIFFQKRRKILKRHFDELSTDHRFDSSEEIFRINIFIKILDVVINQLDNRFKGMQEVVQLFSCIHPNKLLVMKEREIISCAEAIQRKYSEDITTEFPLQMVMVKSMLHDEISKISSIRELADLLIVKLSTIAAIVPQVITALLLFLTLPVTVASAERSFSKLKIIKNYLRNTIGKERLSDLAIVSIEAKAAGKMEMKNIITDFANMKSRRKVFTI